MNPEYILNKYKISKKTLNGKDGKTRYVFSLQFTYPKGIKNQITGTSEEEIYHKLNKFFKIKTITFHELVSIWANDPRINHGQLAKKKRCLVLHPEMGPVLNDKIVCDITTDDIHRAGIALKDKGTKPITINHAFTLMKRFFEYAIEEGYATKNPALDVVRFREDNTFERGYLSDKEIATYLEGCKKRAKGNLLAIFLLSSIPTKELIGIRWKDINWENNHISISRVAKSRISKELVLLEARDCYQAIEPPFVMEYFKKELETQSNIFSINKKILQKSAKPIFYHHELGSNMSCEVYDNLVYSYIRHTLHFTCPRANIRFTSAVITFKSGGDIACVGKLVGKYRAIDMFRNPERFDCFRPRKSKTPGDYFDELFNSIAKNI